MQKIALSLLVILTFGFYIYRGNDQAEGMSTSQSVKQSSSSKKGATSQNSYKDGSYTGDVTDAFFGNIQVKAEISNGKISNIEILQYPNDRATSVRINDQALPILIEEAISVQNANVDIVTGATQSSEAFVKSLESALNQAQNT